MDNIKDFFNKYYRSCEAIQTSRLIAKKYIYLFFTLAQKINPQFESNISALFSALPYNPDTIDFNFVLNALANLGYIYEKKTIPFEKLKKIDFPCIVEKNNKYILLNKDDNDLIQVYHSKENLFKAIDQSDFQDKSLIVYTFHLLQEEENDLSFESCRFNSISWFYALAIRFKVVFKQFLLVTLILHIMSISSPIYIMLVYDKVINAHQISTIIPLTIGIVIIIFFEQILKYFRAMALSNISSRIDYIVNTAVVEKLLSLPVSLIESSSITSQVARLKSFASIRDFFSGPIFISSIDIPFSILMLIALAFISIKLIILPIIAICIFIILMLLLYNITKVEINKSAETNTAKQKELNEFVEKIYELRYSGLVSHYKHILKNQSLKAAYYEYRSLTLSSFIDSMGRAVALTTALGTLIYGALLAIQDEISVGALIASIFLIWRILSPLQNLASSISRLEKLRKSIQQVNAFMNIIPEQKSRSGYVKLKKATGNIKFSNVGFKYENINNFIIRDLSFEISPSQLVIITGPSGSGKTTVLKLINGMLLPNIGTISIDNINIKHLEVSAPRENMHFTLQHPTVVSGNIIDNLKIVNPLASDKQIEYALNQANAMTDIKLLSDNIHTIISAEKTAQLPKSLLYKLNIARIYLSQAPILLIDHQPSIVMNELCGENLINHLTQWKENKTVIVVTYRTDIIQLADKVICLQ